MVSIVWRPVRLYRDCAAIRFYARMDRDVGPFPKYTREEIAKERAELKARVEALDAERKELAIRKQELAEEAALIARMEAELRAKELADAKAVNTGQCAVACGRPV